MAKMNTFKESKPAYKREAAYHDAKDYKEPMTMTGADYADRTIYARRAAEFQAMSNPMKQTAFEQQRVSQEKLERMDHRDQYIKGIQGRDGGNRCDKFERTFEDGPEVN
jgi:hypothetical protein